MASSIDVTVTITQDSLGVQRAGFGVPLLLSNTAAWSGDRVRTYTDLSGVAADFATTSYEYLWAAAMFAQNPSPRSVKIARGDLPATQVYTITPVVQNNYQYRINVRGDGVTEEEVSYTSDGTALLSEITAGLTSALNGVTGKNYTAVDGGTEVVVTATAAGDWFSLRLGSPGDAVIEQTHVDPGVATDLAEILLEDSDWYALFYPYNSNAVVNAIATWAESAKRLYFAEVNESEALTTAAGNSDSLDDLKTAAYEYSVPVYHSEPAETFAAAWAGQRLPTDPGSSTWKFKTLAGVNPDTYTGTHRTNLLARNGNGYETRAGVNMAFEGKCASGTYIDIRRGLDWLEDTISTNIIGVLTSVEKVPFTDQGVAQIEAEVRAALIEGVSQGLIAEDPAFVVTVPKVADVSAADKAARLLPDIKFSATLQGAVHSVNVTGVVSL